MFKIFKKEDPILKFKEKYNIYKSLIGLKYIDFNNAKLILNSIRCSCEYMIDEISLEDRINITYNIKDNPYFNQTLTTDEKSYNRLDYVTFYKNTDRNEYLNILSENLQKILDVAKILFDKEYSEKGLVLETAPEVKMNQFEFKHTTYNKELSGYIKLVISVKE